MSKRYFNHSRLWLAAILLFGFGTSTATEGLRDGPYVIRNDDGRWISHTIDDATVRRATVASGEDVAIPAIGSVPAFTVRIRPPHARAPAEAAPPADAPLFVVADTHGELEIAVELLQQHGVIDAALRWSFGKGYLVILGDVFDRGAHHTELLWLIYKLEAEAREAGGAVHLLIGNHESLVLLGDERYLHPKYPGVAAALGAPRYAALWSPRSLLGDWLRTKAAVMKIDKYLCAHGGIAPQAVELKLTIEAMNEAMRDALDLKHALPPTRFDPRAFVMGPIGPLWYRGYFVDQREQGGPPRATPDEVARILDFYGAEKILVGHTRVPTVTSLYDGRIVAVQVYPQRHPETGTAVMEALLIREGRFFKASADGSLQPLN